MSTRPERDAEPTPWMFRIVVAAAAFYLVVRFIEMGAWLVGRLG